MLMRYQAALRSDRGISGEASDHIGTRQGTQRARNPPLGRSAGEGFPNIGMTAVRPSRRPLARAPQDEVFS